MKKVQLILVLFLLVFTGCSSSDTDELIITPPQNDDMEMEEEEEEEEEEMETQILMGDFMNDAHPTSGVAKVDVSAEKLFFENFRTDNGPQLLVYLSNDIVATEYVNLGALQGVEGDFVYDIPSNVDFETYKYVLIWCVDFSVNFGYAELQ